MVQCVRDPTRTLRSARCTWIGVIASSPPPLSDHRSKALTESGQSLTITGSVAASGLSHLPPARCRPAPTVPFSINWISPTHHRGRAAVVFHFLCLHGARIFSPDLCFWTAGCGCVMPRWVLDGSWCYLCVYFFLLPLVVCHRTDALIRYLRYVSDIGLFMVGILFPPL